MSSIWPFVAFLSLVVIVLCEKSTVRQLARRVEKLEAALSVMLHSRD